MKRPIAAWLLLMLLPLLAACSQEQTAAILPEQVPAGNAAATCSIPEIAVATARRAYLIDPTSGESATRISAQVSILNGGEQPLGPLSAALRFELHVGSAVHPLTPEYFQPGERADPIPMSAKTILAPGQSVSVSLVTFLDLPASDRQQDAELVITAGGATLRWTLPATE